MPGLGRAGKDFFEDIFCRAGQGLCDFLWGIADKLDDFAGSIKVDEETSAALPEKMVEKKRKTKPPAGVFSRAVQKGGITGEQIKVHRVLEGFDKPAIGLAKNRILDACRFIANNAENEAEGHIAAQLEQMIQKGGLIITDAELVLDRQAAGCFYIKDGTPSIGLDIAALGKADGAELVNVLVHEAYHAWRYFTSGTEYSIIDEKRAWNTALDVSNRYRNRYGIPVERETAYTEADLLKYSEYSSNANVNIRYGPGENIIERAGYGIANLIDDAADVINGWTGKLMDKTFSDP
ncbi:MAG: hypothetical protein LBK77_03430 [Spirochaetaceae bacterium]|jgi:hypothetical protein|nr:hypothetical protein [Spirochaetaceae bacterium]